MKIGPHVIFGTDRALAWVSGAPIVKAIDDRGVIVKAAAGGTPIRIFRHYFPTQDLSRDGADVAREVLQALGDAPATHIELFNETAQRLSEGLKEHVRLTSQAQVFLASQRPDLTLVGFSFSTGQPQDDDWLYLKEAGFGGAPVIGIHEYWGPGLDGNETRHKQVHTLLDGTHPPFLITECGRDIAGDVRLGWKTQGLTPLRYAGELARFAADIEPLNYVLGATMYTAGANYDATPREWDSFDCDPLDVPGLLQEFASQAQAGGELMADVPEEAKLAMDEVRKLGLDAGKVYKASNGWPKGTQLVFADGGIFVIVPGVPGAYALADARKVVFRQS